MKSEMEAIKKNTNWGNPGDGKPREENNQNHGKWETSTWRLEKWRNH